MTDKYLDSTILQLKAMAKDQKEVTDGYDPFKVQVGGNHYARFKIQPMVYIEQNNLPFADGAVVKYITRWRYKNPTKAGRLEDLRKAKHFIEMLIALEEQKNAKD